MGDVIGDADHLTVIRRRDVEGLFDTTPDLSGELLGRFAVCQGWGRARRIGVLAGCSRRRNLSKR